MSRADEEVLTGCQPAQQNPQCDPTGFVGPIKGAVQVRVVVLRSCHDVGSDMPELHSISLNTENITVRWDITTNALLHAQSDKGTDCP
ncbi:uncharacterized [Tachysurus ichikawai]